MALTIKPEFQNKVLGFAGSALPLGQRTALELKLLLVLSYASNRTDYVNMYINPPTLSELLTGTGSTIGVEPDFISVMQQLLAVQIESNKLLFDAGRERTDADFRGLNVNSLVGNFPPFPAPSYAYSVPLTGKDADGKIWGQITTTTISFGNKTTEITYTDGTITQSNMPAGFALVAGGGGDSGTGGGGEVVPDNGELRALIMGAILGGNVSAGLMSTLLYDPSSYGLPPTPLIPDLPGDGYTPTVPANVPTITDRISLFFYNEDPNHGAIGSLLLERTAFILSDGRIVDGNGESGVKFPFPATGTGAVSQYRVRVKHRNHLSVFSNIITNAGLNKKVDYDFTTGQAQAYQKAGSALSTAMDNRFTLADGTPIYAMWMGDVIGDDKVDEADNTELNIQKSQGGFGEYKSGDLSLDLFVDSQDSTHLNDVRNIAGGPTSTAAAHNPYTP